MTTPASIAFKGLFGTSLLKSKDEKVETWRALDGKKAVGILFSGHWCGPCRGFTPKVKEYYEKDLKNKGLEIVFVSSDSDQKAFDDYFAEQPWLALPYEERKLKDALSKKFKVRGIPSFVILDGETGELITTEGRSCIMSDPTGEDFEKTKWAPPALKDIIGTEFQINKKDGSEKVMIKKEDAFKDVEAIGIYFSAHWCPPCRSFTPELVNTYEKLNSGGRKDWK